MPAVPQHSGAGIPLPAIPLPAPPVMQPLPTAQHGATSSDRGDSYAPAPAPAWSSQATAASQAPSVTHANGWQATTEPATELPGLGPDRSTNGSVRKRSRWSDAQLEQTAPRYEAASESLSALATAAQQAPMLTQSSQWSDSTQNGTAHTQREGGAGALSAPDGYLPPPPPMQQQQQRQQTGDRAGASGNGVTPFRNVPPAPQAAAVLTGGSSSASRPARRSRWESAPAAEPAAADAGSRAPPQRQSQLSQPTPAAVPARPLVAAPAAPQASVPVWTGEGVAPWLVAQEAAAEARRAAQGVTDSSQQSAQPGMAQHQQGANAGLDPPPASRLPLQQHAQQRHQAASQTAAPRPGAAVTQHHLGQQQQAHRVHGRPPGLAQPRLGPPPPSIMPVRPMAGGPPPLPQQQQQHPQQHYGMAPATAFFPGGGHMHPGHMHPGHMHPGFPPPTGFSHGMPPRPWPPLGPRPPPGQPSGAGTALMFRLPGCQVPKMLPTARCLQSPHASVPCTAYAGSRVAGLCHTTC